MKNINDLTLKEFELYNELISVEENPDIYSIFELFGEDVSNLKFDVFNKKWLEIQSMIVKSKGVKLVYKVGDKRFKPTLNIMKIKAGQFVDLQYIIQSGNKIEDIMSVILLPQHKTFLGWKTRNYGVGYDILELRKYLYENMKIGDAYDLSAFFLKSCNKLLKITKDYSQKKLLKMKMKEMKENK